MSDLATSTQLLDLPNELIEEVALELHPVEMVAMRLESLLIVLNLVS